MVKNAIILNIKHNVFNLRDTEVAIHYVCIILVNVKLSSNALCSYTIQVNETFSKILYNVYFHPLIQTEMLFVTIFYVKISNWIHYYLSFPGKVTEDNNKRYFMGFLWGFFWKYNITNNLVHQSTPPWMYKMPTTLCDTVCQWVATGQWFSPGL